MLIQTFPMTLIDAYFLTAEVKHFVFQPAFDLSYLPGQFITLHFEQEGQLLRRSYSIANPPSSTKFIEFAAGYIKEGPGTAYLFNLKPGDQVKTTGPFGRLILKESNPKRYIFIATSTGITPYRSMIETLKNRLAANRDLYVVILEGIRTIGDILYAKDFLDFKKLFPEQVLFRAQLSRSSQKTEAYHYLGHVQAAFGDLALNPEQDLVYLCGNPAMIDQSFETLKEKGFHSQQIIREKYISSK